MCVCVLYVVGCFSAGKAAAVESELRSELKHREAELESLKQAASTEQREKADMIAAEKKARLQVNERGE